MSLQSKDMDGNESPLKKKKYGEIGQNLRRDHALSVWTTSYIHNAMSKIALTKGITMSSLIHRYCVNGINNEEAEDITVLEKQVARAEADRRDAEDERMMAQRTTEIASIPSDVARYCETDTRRGMPTNIIIEEVIEPNIKAMQRVDSLAAKWAIEKLEELKKKYEENNNVI